MAGINRISGKSMPSDWSHVVQSIGVILSTSRLERYMRREFGSDLPRLVDAPITPATIIDFYAATAGAINEYEPRYRVSRMRVEGADKGHLTMRIEGVYFPRGHLGDFSVSSPQTVEVPL